MANFIENLLEEIHREDLEKKKEVEELMERLSKEGEDEGWIKLFGRLK